MSKGQRFTDEFKTQIVRLYQTGKPVIQLSNEYDIATQSKYNWIKEGNTIGSFKTVDNLSEEQRELKALRKRTAELKMENDILKQAALISGC